MRQDASLELALKQGETARAVNEMLVRCRALGEVLERLQRAPDEELELQWEALQAECAALRDGISVLSADSAALAASGMLAECAECLRQISAACGEQAARARQLAICTKAQLERIREGSKTLRTYGQALRRCP